MNLPISENHPSTVEAPPARDMIFSWSSSRKVGRSANSCSIARAVIVLDCPPALDLLTLNALVAADTVIIPMQAEYFALEGVTELLDTIDRIRVQLNQSLAVEGVVLTMFDERTNLAQSVAAELRNFFGDLMCKTTIPRNVRLAEAPSHGKPAMIYDAQSRGAQAYLMLAEEIMKKQQPAASS